MILRSARTLFKGYGQAFDPDFGGNEMKELLEFIAKSMVSEPDAVSIEENVQENSVVLTLHVAEGDMGKVIGKQGRIAKAIRTVVKAAASHENKKVTVDIV